MMMAFNVDMLEELGTANVDLSGRLSIRTSANGDAYALALDNLMAGTVKTSLLGNENAPVVSEIKSFVPSVVKLGADGKYEARNKFATTAKKIYGSLYISGYTNAENNYSVTLTQVGDSSQTVTINCVDENDLNKTLKTLGFTIEESGFGTYWKDTTLPYIDDEGNVTLYGPQRIITAIVRIEATDKEQLAVFNDLDQNMKVTVKRKVADDAIPVCIGTEFIKLESAMKLANIVPTGGSAKHEIQEGFVAVNGEICTMRGKKLYPGDRFTFEGETYLITIHAAV